jgi:chorismate synthase
MGAVLRWLTAGESHGPALVAVLEGLPADVRITTDDVATRSPAGAPATAAAPG